MIWLLLFMAASAFIFSILIWLTPLPPQAEPDSAAKPVSGGVPRLPSLNPLNQMSGSTSAPSLSALHQAAPGALSARNAQNAAIGMARYQNQLAQQNAIQHYSGLGNIMSSKNVYSIQPQPLLPPQAKDQNLAASDLMEEFIKYAAGQGLAEKQARELPVDVFLTYIVFAASKAEGHSGDREKDKIDAAMKAAIIA